MPVFRLFQRGMTFASRNAETVLQSFTHRRKSRCSRCFRKHPQCHWPCLQHVCRSHIAIRVIHPIGIYTHNASATGICIIHPIAVYIHNAFCIIRPITIYTHNAKRITHPIAIYTHNAIGFVLKLCSCLASCFFCCVFFAK